MFIARAIFNLRPDLNVSVQGNDLETAIINWNGATPIPNEEIQAEIDRLIADDNAKEYQRKREFEYPNLKDCIHALLDGGDTLTELQEKRQAIKNKYPKPE
jgi:hypothetical protein